MSTNAYEAVLILSFGGPEGPQDVEPFLDNVLRGRSVPPERRRKVAEQYHRFDGVSPLNSQNRKLRDGLEAALKERGISLPVYVANRNWHPFLRDVLKELERKGIRNVLAFTTSAFGTYSSCRQYLENIRDACASAPTVHVDKVRLFFNHPGFIRANADQIRATLMRHPQFVEGSYSLLFTAHSIPVEMAQKSPYCAQLKDACANVANMLSVSDWKLVYQSRSGRPGTPWLEPDVQDELRSLAATGMSRVLIHPIGFLSDHMEVIYDLDTEAKALAESLGMELIRSSTVLSHPEFVEMICDLISERIQSKPRMKVGALDVWPDRCPESCCL